MIQIKSLNKWMGREINRPSNAQGAAFFPLIWIPKMFAEERLGFENYTFLADWFGRD